MHRPHPKALRILGTRGVPGRHGGFESFAEDLAPFLAARGWDVTVYCQIEGGAVREDTWRNVRLISLPVRRSGAAGTIEFDWKSTRHAAATGDPVLVLGYNTAVFGAAYRPRRTPYVLNMDGLEWKRQKYSLPERCWLWLNEQAGCRLATHLIADHPLIQRRYAASVGDEGVTMVPYGSRIVSSAPVAALQAWHLLPNGYTLVIARPEPENYILEMVRTFSRVRRHYPMVVVGPYSRRCPYQRAVLDAAGPDVIFPGPIYDRDTVDALRFHALLYVHGHCVGGTNPSLVEALGAGTAILARDNGFNRWVCADAAAYFQDEADLACSFNRLVRPLGEHERRLLRSRARLRHESAFNLEQRLREYEAVLARLLGVDIEHGVDVEVAYSSRSVVA